MPDYSDEELQHIALEATRDAKEATRRNLRARQNVGALGKMVGEAINKQVAQSGQADAFLRLTVPAFEAIVREMTPDQYAATDKALDDLRDFLSTFNFPLSPFGSLN